MLDDNGRWVNSQSRCSMQRSGAEKEGKRESCSDDKKLLGTSIDVPSKQIPLCGQASSLHDFAV